MTGDVVRRLVAAHVDNDSAAFRDAVQSVITEERRLSHHTLANELERLVSTEQLSSKTASGSRSSPHINGTPKDRERNVPLIELVEPERDLDSLVLTAAVRQQLDRIVEEWRRADVLRSHGLLPVAKVLFCGPPGCGKTVSAEAIAKSLYLPLAIVRFDAVVSSYLGETAANLRKVFDYARSRPMVLLFDEFDAIGKQRTGNEDHGELKRVVNSFLQIMDSFRSHSLTIAATNHAGILDAALWRRFDDVVQFPLPTQDEIESLLIRHFRQMTVAPSVRLLRIAKQLEGWSHADVERVAVDSIKHAILNDLDTVDGSAISVAINRQVTRGHVANATAGSLPTKKPRAKHATSSRRRSSPSPATGD